MTFFSNACTTALCRYVTCTNGWFLNQEGPCAESMPSSKDLCRAPNDLGPIFKDEKHLFCGHNSIWHFIVGRHIATSNFIKTPNTDPCQTKIGTIYFGIKVTGFSMKSNGYANRSPLGSKSSGVGQWRSKKEV